MIDNRLVSSKAVLAKIIADLDLKEDEIKITDISEWIGEAMEKIGAIQQLEHKVVNIPVENYQAKLPCDLYRMNQVAFSDDPFRYNNYNNYYTNSNVSSHLC